MKRVPRLPRLVPLLLLPLLLGLAATSPTGAAAPGVDPAARGLDVFIHVPDRAAPGSLVPVQIEAFGFSTIVTPAPLAGAIVEAGWDPEGLGAQVSVVPPSVHATTDAEGRSQLWVPVPHGDVAALTLLIGVRHGGHSRTQSVTIQRGSLRSVALRVADTQVVPGSAISAWIMVTDASTGDPTPQAPVTIELLEGGTARTSVRLTADPVGMAMVRVPIPSTNEPGFKWQLRARSGVSGRVAGEASITLTPREETPSTPSLEAGFTEDAVFAGDRATYKLRILDGSEQPVENLPVRVWLGPHGTEPPKNDEEFERKAIALVTDAEGFARGSIGTPTLVRPGGTSFHLVAKAVVEGHPLEGKASIQVGTPSATAEILPQGGSLVPGLDQTLLLRVHGDRGDPVSAPFVVKGDGLDATVTTDAHGEAELLWHAPIDLGSRRDVGPCAGGVAAAVVVRPAAAVPALRTRRDPFSLCLPVNRDASGLLVTDRTVVRMGEDLAVQVVPALRSKHDGSASGWSVMLRSATGDQTAASWIRTGSLGTKLHVPKGAPGVWTLTAVSPGLGHASSKLETSVVVAPPVLPVLAAAVVSGRPEPGGAVDLDVALTDDRGRPSLGTVTAVVIDKNGGGSTEGIEAMDTREDLCRGVGIESDRCGQLADDKPTLDPALRGLLGAFHRVALAPARDPGEDAQKTLHGTFGAVLRSLEGAIYEASSSADRIVDVRRKGPRGSEFNPELLTLVTAAMEPPPTTPGGEPVTLADLLAIDPQVTFDKVARRVTRLKLFRVLSAVRKFRREHGYDADEPLLKQPNAILRRLVREGALDASLLLDPWGGTLQFVPSTAPPIPFLTAARGFELHAPGPDGKVGTGDDVRDPFERVLQSGTPYAKAVDEDRSVDAKLDMEVSDATVSAWETMFEQTFGSNLGLQETIGHGGGGVTGVAYGSGHGRLGGSHHARGTFGVALGSAFWSLPERTDANGHVRIHVPLGDVETTWRIALVGVADGGRAATTHVDVPVTLPLSVHVMTGVRWIEGDILDAHVAVRNRANHAIHAVVTASATGSVKLTELRPGGSTEAARAIDVPAAGLRVVRFPVASLSTGWAGLHATVRAPGMREDHVDHRWEVLGPGEPTMLVHAAWAETRGELAVTMGPAGSTPDPAEPFMRLTGRPRLVIQRGASPALWAALESLDPNHATSPGALVEAIDVAQRIQRWAVSAEGDGSPLALQAEKVERWALGRVEVFRDLARATKTNAGRLSASLEARLVVLVPPDPKAEKGKKGKDPLCPDASVSKGADLLDGEPPEGEGGALPCWDAFASSMLSVVQTSMDPVEVATAFMAVVDRPRRAAAAVTLIDRLREQVALKPSGAITLPESSVRDRAARTTVRAALLRGAGIGKKGEASPDRLAAWLSVERDADGGYGSPTATRHAVRGLISAHSAPVTESSVCHLGITSGTVKRTVDVHPSERLEIPLDEAATRVGLEIQGPGVEARLERPALRLWSHPPDALESPLSLEITWPTDARAGRHGMVTAYARGPRDTSATIEVRIPLPPGASLAEPVEGVRQIQGVLFVRRNVAPRDAPLQIDLPVRFTIAGRVTVPEAQISVPRENIQRAVAPARPLVIE